MAIFNWKPKLVLPTVYDDALSYQEILGKVIDALNQMGETGKLVNAVFPNENPVISVRDNGINIVGKAKIVYMDGTEKDCDIDMTIPLAKGDNVNLAVVDGVVKIFATDTTYTAGSGIVFEGTVVKANYDEVQRKLTAGEGIVIQGTTIAIDPSVIGEEIVAGNGITVTGNTISVDYSKVQAKLTAGNGIVIQEATITIDPDRVEVIENKTNTLSADSTAVQYPSAKAVYDKVTAVEEVANTANSRSTTAQATANDANELATNARSTANTAKTAAEQAEAKADAAKTQAANALETADAAQAAATVAQNRADSAYNLANTADTASQQNASRIQIIEDTAPQFSLEGTTLTITLLA